MPIHTSSSRKRQRGRAVKNPYQYNIPFIKPGSVLLLLIIKIVILSAAHPESHFVGQTAPSHINDDDVALQRNDRSDVDETDSTTRRKIQHMLDEVCAWQSAYERKRHHHKGRPFVTLTFAQSLDGKIALRLPHVNVTNIDQTTLAKTKVSSNLPISGPESLLFTHGLRSIHDAILVGGRTLLIDNPRLSNRLWGTALPQSSTEDNQANNSADMDGTATIHNHELFHQPVPIILDTHLKCLRELAFNPRACAQPHGETGQMRLVVVCCSKEAYSSLSKLEKEQAEKQKIQFLCFDVESSHSVKNDTHSMNAQHLDLSQVLFRLYDECDIHSVMVEGGASVLAAFARASSPWRDGRESLEIPLIDCLCVTIAPKLLGQMYGIPAFAGNILLASQTQGVGSNLVPQSLPSPSFVSLGEDCILISQWPDHSTDEA